LVATPRPRESPETGGWGETQLTPQDIVALVSAQEPAAAPGTVCSYSNANFILLGLIIEERTGSTWAAEVRARLLDPLGLTHTFLEGSSLRSRPALPQLLRWS